MADKKDVRTVFHKFDPVIYPYKIYIAVSNNVNDIPLNFNEYSGKEIVFIENKDYYKSKQEDKVLHFWSGVIMNVQQLTDERPSAGGNASFSLQTIFRQLKEDY